MTYAWSTVELANFPSSTPNCIAISISIIIYKYNIYQLGYQYINNLPLVNALISISVSVYLKQVIKSNAYSFGYNEFATN